MSLKTVNLFQALTYLQGIKIKLGKASSELLSIDEFCETTGFKIEKVASFMTG